MKVLFFVLFCTNLLAHQTSLSQIIIKHDTKANTLKATLNISIKDIKILLNTAKYTQSNTQELYDIIKNKLVFSKQKSICKIYHNANPYKYKQKNDIYLQIPFEIKCSRYTNNLKIFYNLFFDIDKNHKSLLRLLEDKKEKLFLLQNNRKSYILKTQNKNKFEVYIELFIQGIKHISNGYDHLLFLLSLLLSCVLVYKNGKYTNQPNLKNTLLAVFQIITAFTVAHSVSLGLALYDVISFDTRFIEILISLSIILIALHNIKPIIQDKIWIYIFFIGLIHGMGFATFLSGLELLDDIKLNSLLFFNLGIEAGQLLFVILLLPALYLLSKTKIYQQKLIYLFSVVIACFGVWLLIGTM